MFYISVWFVMVFVLSIIVSVFIIMYYSRKKRELKEILRIESNERYKIEELEKERLFEEEKKKRRESKIDFTTTNRRKQEIKTNVVNKEININDDDEDDDYVRRVATGDLLGTGIYGGLDNDPFTIL